jgi:FtsP/CotA-like multicopper oxidase with cupredoxin domain
MLKISLLGAAALTLPFERTVTAKTASRIAESKLPKPFTVPFAAPPVLAPVRSTATTDFYEVVQKPALAEILPGVKTPVFGYNGITPGPTLKVTQGRDAVVRQINALPGKHPTLRYEPWTSTHLHGSASLPEFDGYASDITRPGQYKDYRYPNIQPARTLWYHDHGVHHTGENVYMGLAGLYLMTDPVEKALPLPTGRYDVPLVLQDKIFDKDGSFLWDDNGHSGLWGDVILVNGRPWPVMKVERRKYRFRVLNGSLARGFRYRLSTGDPITVIACDGGLMTAPQQVSELRHGMAERYEIVIDFAKYKVGQRVVLQNLGVPNSRDYDTTRQIMAFDVASEPTDTSNNTVPPVLNPRANAMDLTPAMSKRTRKLEVLRTGGEWAINGLTWENVVKSGYEAVVADPGANDVEIWEITNKSGGWFHPVHIHLVDFQILDRNGKPPRPEERGPKDVVYIGENETVRVIMRFEHQLGRYMVHCHNLPHEDHDMMTQFRVGPPGAGHDPITAAPALPYDRSTAVL